LRALRRAPCPHSAVGACSLRATDTAGGRILERRNRMDVATAGKFCAEEQHDHGLAARALRQARGRRPWGRRPRRSRSPRPDRARADPAASVVANLFVHVTAVANGDARHLRRARGCGRSPLHSWPTRRRRRSRRRTAFAKPSGTPPTRCRSPTHHEQALLRGQALDGPSLERHVVAEEQTCRRA
jgi:hypothetical protein